MSDQLEQWALVFRDRYEHDVESKIRRQFKVLTREASRIFRNLEITGSEYHTKIHRLMSAISYMRTCLQNVQEGDLSWYRNYVKTCLEQLYGIVDYPDTEAWDRFFKNHTKDRDKILRKVKGNLLQKLSKY